MEFKFPTSQAEMDALRKSLVQKISDDDLEAVAGGNDDMKGKNEGTPLGLPRLWSDHHDRSLPGRW